jgi:hypothetical protein
MSTNLKSIKVDFTSFFVKIRVICGLFLFLFLNAVALNKKNCLFVIYRKKYIFARFIYLLVHID